MSGDGMDLDDLLVEAQIAESSESEADAGLSELDETPPDEGERDKLSELAAGAEEEDAEGDDDDGAEDDSEDDEDDSDEAYEPDDEDAQVEDEDDQDEGDDEIAQIKALLQEEREERKKLERYLFQQQEAEQQRGASPQQQQPQAPDPQFVSAVKALMLGSDPEQAKAVLERVPPHVRDYAVNWVRDANERMVQYEIQPELRYRDQIAPLVEQQIQRLMEPIVRDRTKAQAADALAPFREILKTSADKAAVAKILDDMPGGGDMRKRVAYAVEIYQARSNGKAVVAKKRKLDDKSRDLKAQKRSRRRGGKSRSKKGRKSLPDMDGFNAKKFADQIEGMDIDDAEWKAFFS